MTSDEQAEDHFWLCYSYLIYQELIVNLGQIQKHNKSSVNMGSDEEVNWKVGAL